MTEQEIVSFVSMLPDAEVVTPRKGDGSPEVSWGDSFIYVRLPGEQPSGQRWPFATIVTNDYPGWDTASQLDREGVFRLNVSVGRHVFEELFGYGPAAQPQHQERFEYSALDRLIPHPVYATQGWVSILNPGDGTSELVRSLLAGAHAREVRRHRAGG